MFSPLNHFDCLLRFLKKQEEILEELDQLEPASAEKGTSEKVIDSLGKTAFTKSTVGQKEHQDCIVCGEISHPGRLFACKIFRDQDLQGKRAYVRKLELCWKCLRSHSKGDKGCTTRFLCPKVDCRRGGVSDHNYLLCPKPPVPKGETTG